MSKLGNSDFSLQLTNDQNRVEADRFYGWDIDVADCWYQHCPVSLNDRDAFYEDSSYRFF